MRIALPEFRPATPDAKLNHLADVFNETLWNDLDFSGNLLLASRSFYPLGSFVSPGDIHPADWMKTGLEAQYISFGSVAMGTGRFAGQFTADVRFMDLKVNQEVIPGQRMGGGNDTDAAARVVAHGWADMILENLGFGKGVARTSIAYVSGDRIKEIYTMDYDGNDAKPLTALGDLAITPAWSPDGTSIAFEGYRGNVTNIEVVSRSGGIPKPFPSPSGNNITPAWSPDGSRIAFSSSRGNNGKAGNEIYVANANGSGLSRLVPRASVGHAGDVSPVWNPKTGRQIAFISDRSGSQQIWRVNDDGSSLTRIFNDGGDAEMPSWSPDGNFIAFAWMKSGTSHYDIYVHDLVTDHNTQLTQNAGNNEKPTWSPDGKHIAFQSDRAGNRIQIYSMLADGNKVRQLTKNGENKAPAWSGFTK